MLKVGIPQIGMRAGSLYQRLEFDARQAALRNGAALWYAGGKNDLAGFVFQDSVGTTAATGTDPVGLLLDRSRVAGESYGAQLISPSAWAPFGTGGVTFTNNPTGTLNFTRNGDSNGQASQTITNTAGKYYRISWTVNSGNTTVFAFGDNIALSNGQFVQFTTAAQRIAAWPTSDLTSSSISNISVQEAVGNLGPELVTVNSATMTGAVAFTAIAGSNVVVGNWYRVSYTINQSSGTSQAACGGAAFPAESGIQNKTYTQYIQASTTGGVSYFSNAAVGTVSNFSCKQLLGYPALQATSGNRPTLELQANGYYGLRFDGSNDNFTEALTLNGTTPYTIIAAAKASNSAGTRSLVVGGLVAAGGNQRFPQLRVESGTGRIAAVFINDASVTQFVGNTTSVNGTSFVASITGAGAGQLSTLYLNGASNGTATAPVGPYTADTGLLGIYTGSLEGWDNPYFLICVAKTEFPAADRRAIERFAALLSGASYA